MVSDQSQTTDFTNPSGGPGGGGWCRPSQRPNERPDPVIKDTRIRPWDRTPNILIDLLSSLVAAVSLLKKGSKKAAPSDRMFDAMVADYEKAIERGLAALKELDHAD